MPESASPEWTVQDEESGLSTKVLLGGDAPSAEPGTTVLVGCEIVVLYCSWSDGDERLSASGKMDD